jgi:hypothetical protein
MWKPNLEQREQLKGVRADVWMILKWILKKLNSSGSGYSSELGSFEQGYEHLGAINLWKLT